MKAMSKQCQALEPWMPQVHKFHLPNIPPMTKEQRIVEQRPFFQKGLTFPMSTDDGNSILDKVEMLTWESQKREYVNGLGKAIGCTALKSGEVIIAGLASNTCPLERRELVRTANASLRNALGTKQFYWSSLQFNVNSVAGPHEDKGNVGLSAYVMLGEYQKGELWIL